MPPALSYPGVYVQEVASGVRTITGVGTSIAAFVGRTARGPVRAPKLCLSIDDFNRQFSSRYAKSDLARSVALFFANGGTQCWVTRIANSPAAAKVDLRNEAGASVLTAEAVAEGLDGNNIRLVVDYNTLDSESTFNLQVFRWEKQSNGTLLKRDTEVYNGLDMDPNSPRFAVTMLANSALVKLTDLGVEPNAFGSSRAGRAIAGGALPNGTPSVFHDQCKLLFGAGPSVVGNMFRISVDGNPYVLVDLSAIDVDGMTADGTIYDTLGAEVAKAIHTADPTVTVTVEFKANAVPNAGDAYGQAGKANEVSFHMTIKSAKGDVRVQPAPAKDLAAAMMMGPSFGGVEIGKHANRRPAANGVVFNLGDGNDMLFGSRLQTELTALKITTPGAGDKTIALTGANTLNTNTTVAGSKMFQDAATKAAAPGAPDPASDGVREKWAIIAAAINAANAGDPAFPWTAQVWGLRLALIPTAAAPDNQTAAIAATGAANPPFTKNTGVYSLGLSGSGAFQANGKAGDDGGKPLASDYADAYKAMDKEIDLFNLLILPKDAEHTDSETNVLWGPASVFCLNRRAFLLMDPPASWKDAQTATSPTVGANTLRIGLVKDHSAVFFPRLTINENGAKVQVGPSGAVAGLMARIDSARGVWKAPAGTEADIRGVVGVEYRFTDGENGVMNPRGVNVARVFPEGIVQWGARTMDGDDAFGSEYKYIPIRRLALNIEESLYRGLKWVVFEPNDEPLWSQIRLNVGAFMNNLFRQGAFQGQTPKDSYFVRCDKDTTTQNDRDLGIVNILVGFAPLKPAEFVVLTLQQMAGQIAV